MITRITNTVEHNGNKIPVYKSILNVDDTFKIDGFTETIAKIEFFENQFYYTCQSCACYNESNLNNI